jgi:hypothetical protein
LERLGALPVQSVRAPQQLTIRVGAAAPPNAGQTGNRGTT